MVFQHPVLLRSSVLHNAGLGLKPFGLGCREARRLTMQALERQLDPARFPRIHRSTIVNARRVREIRPHANGEGHLVLDCGRSLKLSRGYRDRLERLR